MGSAKSVIWTEGVNHLPVQKLLDYVMPIYYTKLPLLPHEKQKILHSWKLIIANKAAGFYKLKAEDPDFTPCGSPMEFFANRITIRLIEVHPVCQAMFTKTTLKQGQAFMNMITFLVNEMDSNKFKTQLEMLAASHSKMGIRASEFGIFGEVLFWSIRLTLGNEDYDFVTHTAWIKFYSRILDVIVPSVLQYEMDHKEYYQSFNAKRMMPIMQTKTLIVQGIKENATEKAENTITA